jgi:hypothetical protein
MFQTFRAVLRRAAETRSIALKFSSETIGYQVFPIEDPIPALLAAVWQASTKLWYPFVG